MASREGLQFLMQNMILLQMLFQVENLTQFMLKQHIALTMTLDWFQEFDSPKTLAAFALGLVLFLVTLSLNVIALHVVRKYREQYE